MKTSDVDNLVPGLYRLTFTKEWGGKTALAVVGAFYGFYKPSRWWIVCNMRVEPRRTSDSHLIHTGWEMVEKVELIRSEESDEYIRDAEKLTMPGCEIKPDVVQVIRDLFLSGHDVEAIAMVARELGMSPPQRYSAAMFAVVAAATRFVERFADRFSTGWSSRNPEMVAMVQTVKAWQAFHPDAQAKIAPCRTRGCLAPLNSDGRCVVHGPL